MQSAKQMPWMWIGDSEAFLTPMGWNRPIVTAFRVSPIGWFWKTYDGKNTHAQGSMGMEQSEALREARKWAKARLEILEEKGET